MVCEIAGYEQRKTARSGSRDRGPAAGHGTNMVNLCVDACDGELQSGRLYHQYTKDALPFSSLSQAFRQMNELYDALRFPEAPSELRSFQNDRRSRGHMAAGRAGTPGCGKKEPGREWKETERYDRMIGHRGRCATFLIRVLYRQHASWQGEVTWVERQKTECFRSALELLALLDSALGAGEKKEAE